MAGLNQQQFYGWTALVGLMVAYAGLCGDIAYAYGVFLPVMSETFQWSRSALSGPYGLFYIVGGLLGPVVGLSVARFGARKNIIFSNIIAALGLLGMSQVNAIWHVYLFYGVIAGLGIAFGEFIAMTTIINNWFIRKRSIAMGLLFASGGIGGFIMPPLISLFISNWGWRLAWACLAGIHFFLTIIIGGILIKNRPEDMGQLPDGTPENFRPTQLTQPALCRQVYQTSEDWTAKEAFRTPALWIITLLFSIILFASAMLTTHQVAYLQDLNFSPILSATALGLMIGMSIIGRLACGFLGMRFEARVLAAIFLGGLGLGVLALIMVRGFFFIYIYSIFAGIGFGGMIVLMPNLISAYFGRKHYAHIIGWISPIVTLISAGSPTLAGLLYDATGNYLVPFSLSAGLVFSGIILAVLLRPPRFSEVHG